MQATITEKGEGYVMVRFDAMSGAEALILSSAVPNAPAKGITLSMDSGPNWGASITDPPTKTTVAFGIFAIPVHAVLDGGKGP
jgi:hypothetical protein